MTERSPARLVIVDDEPVILKLLTSVFDDADWDVAACRDGHEAIHAMDVGVDILLTDKNLPDVSGLDLIRHARRVQPDVEALVVTAYASLDTALTALELGVFDYIVKPPNDIFEVRRKVQQARDKQAVVRENRRLVAGLKAKNEELEQALAELNETQAELVQAEKLAGIGTLAAGIAHEISSPLFGIMGLGEAIQDEDDLKVAKGHASEIVQYSRNIKDIVVELTGYSRSAEGEHIGPMDLGRAVEDAVRLVRRSSPVDGVTFDLDLADNLQIHARPSEIQQVFVNLVKNGVEALDERGGQIQVQTGRDQAQVWAEVRDDGPGIPAERRTQIFDPFFTTKAPGQGTGLGLNIVYRIVTRYRGQITVDSHGEGGTVFHLRFPPPEPWLE